MKKNDLHESSGMETPSYPITYPTRRPSQKTLEPTHEVTVSEEDYAEANARVTKHTALVNRIAFHLLSRLPSSVQVDDLIQSGMMGLLAASRKFDPELGASFETYAGIRIRGAMLDEIRGTDWTPRSVHKKARAVAEAKRRIENKKGREARDIEIAEAMGLDLYKYHKILRDSTGCRIFSMEEHDNIVTGYNCDELVKSAEHPPVLIAQAEFRKGMATLVDGLEEKERKVIKLYYYEHMTLKEIGKVFGVTESRVCQMHGAIIDKLRVRLMAPANTEYRDAPTTSAA